MFAGIQSKVLIRLYARRVGLVASAWRGSIGVLARWFAPPPLPYTINNKCNYSDSRNANSSSSSLTRGLIAGFEFPSFSDADMDCIMVDKSLMSGCKYIMTRTSADIARFYQTISDVKTVEELDFSKHKIFHILTTFEKPAMQHGWSARVDLSKLAAVSSAVSTELNTIKLSIKDRLLDVIVLPITFRKDVDMSAVGSYDILVSELVSILNTTISQVNMNIFPQQNSMQYGIDFSTDILHKLNKVDLAGILSKLSVALKEKKFNTKVSYITVATNTFTYEPALIVKDFARDMGIPCFATETCRLHHKRPVQITVAPELMKAYGHMMVTINRKMKKQQQQKQDGVSKGFESSDIIDEVMADHQKILSSSILIEKQYLTKLGKEPIENVNNNILCLGHFIALNHSKFHFPEEFRYIWRTKLSKPHLESRKLVKKSKEELRDWALVYEPVVKKVVDTFEKTLHIRKAQLISEIVESIARHSAIEAGGGLEHAIAGAKTETWTETKTADSETEEEEKGGGDDDANSFDKTLAGIPIVMYKALGDSGFDGVFLSSTLIDPEAMNFHFINRRVDNSDIRSIQTQKIAEFYKDIKTIASGFSD